MGSKQYSSCPLLRIKLCFFYIYIHFHIKANNSNVLIHFSTQLPYFALKTTGQNMSTLKLITNIKIPFLRRLCYFLKQLFLKVLEKCYLNRRRY